MGGFSSKSTNKQNKKNWLEPRLKYFHCQDLHYLIENNNNNNKNWLWLTASANRVKNTKVVTIISGYKWTKPTSILIIKILLPLTSIKCYFKFEMVTFAVTIGKWWLLIRFKLTFFVLVFVRLLLFSFQSLYWSRCHLSLCRGLDPICLHFFFFGRSKHKIEKYMNYHLPQSHRTQDYRWNRLYFWDLHSHYRPPSIISSNLHRLGLTWSLLNKW